jgi:hypothetical protein
MEAKTRRQSILLAVLVVVLIGALWWSFGRPAADLVSTPAAERARTSGSAARTARAHGTMPGPVEPLALDALAAAPPTPTSAGRNPFRFEARAAPPADAEPTQSHAVPAPAPEATGPVTPAAMPIPLRFIGIVDKTARHLKLAVLSDGRNVFYGREGDIIEGRYRIVRIGVESIEMMHVDGRGQQTIRLSGS